MNNWRLLLLAIVAVFQPIASFTDRNFIDGRQQCCDRLSSAPLQDTRSSLHGTNWHDKSALRRLNDRDEIREDRRYEVSQRVSTFSRPSTVRPLVDIRGSVARQGPSETARFSRVDYRLERSASSQSRERLLDVQQREDGARSNRDLKIQDLTRRVVDRTSRDTLERRNDRVYTDSSRERLFKDGYRTERLGNERLSKSLYNPQRKLEGEQFRSVERRITLNRDARRVLRRTKDDVSSLETSNNMNNLQRERLSVVRRESSIRPDTRRYRERYNERRDLYRNNEQRRSLSENSRLVDQIRDMRIDLNARGDKRENQHRLSTKRIQERREQGERRESTQQNKENIDYRTSGNRMQVARRMTRESRIINTQNEKDVDARREIRNSDRISRERGERDIENQREIRHTERNSRETREEIRDNLQRTLSRERTLVNRRDTREFRNTNIQNIDGQRETRNSNRISRFTQRGNQINRFSLERDPVDQRNIREFRVNNNLIARDDDTRIDSRRETRYDNRMHSKSRGENRLNPNHRLSLGRIRMERRNIREFRTVNTPNDKDIDSRWEIRYIERSTEVRKEARLNPEQTMSRGRFQADRRNTREFRNTNNAIPTERDVVSQRQIRADARLHSENRENSNQRLSRERIQMDRQNSRASRIVNSLHERNLDSRRDIKYNENLSRETREVLRESTDRRLTRESRLVDRRNIRESRLNRIPSRNERSIETDTESRREMKYNERLSGQIHGDQFTRERRVESRSAERVNDEERHSLMMDRRARSNDRRNFREIKAEPRLSRSVDSQRRSETIRKGVEHNHKIENREREAIDARSRNVEMTRNRERISSLTVGKMETDNDFTVSSWQYILYTLQAAYLCAIFVQMLTPSRTEKSQKMSLRWLPVSSNYNPIKVD